MAPQGLMIPIPKEPWGAQGSPGRKGNGDETLKAKNGNGNGDKTLKRENGIKTLQERNGINTPGETWGALGSLGDPWGNTP